MSRSRVQWVHERVVIRGRTLKRVWRLEPSSASSSLPDEERGIMYNDSLFNPFARSYEARSETDMSMAEYLESCQRDPIPYPNAPARLLAPPHAPPTLTP